MIAGLVGLMHAVPRYLPQCPTQLTWEALQRKKVRRKVRDYTLVTKDISEKQLFPESYCQFVSKRRLRCKKLGGSHRD